MPSKAAEIIKKNKRFLITGHIRPDGDSLGSEMALYHFLRDMGKQAVVYNRDRTPANYLFLPGTDSIVHLLPPIDNFDAVFILDCGDLQRVGEEGQRLRQARTLVNIDHHLTEGEFAPVTINDPTASSTGELLWRLFQEIATDLSADAANCLYAAILTDTGGFRYANTKRETMLAAAELIGKGANPQWLAENIYENNDRVKLLLLRQVLETLDIETDCRIGSLEVRRQARQELGAGYEHAEGLVDLPRTIRGVEISVLFTEMPEDLIKVSLRSKDGINIEPVARQFGGGGHMNAASCQVKGELASVKKMLFAKLKEALDAWEMANVAADDFRLSGAGADFKSIPGDGNCR